MKIRGPFLVLALALGAAGCDAILGEDRTPETIRYQVLGDAGTEVQLIISSQFVSGITEEGVTQVSVFLADTVNATLPLDESRDISIDRRFYMQALPVDTTTVLEARVLVDVDGRPLFDDSGFLPVDPPFRFVYVFNERTTRIIEVF